MLVAERDLQTGVLLHDYLDKVLLGDSLELLKRLPEGSVDSLVTDPPSSINFMNQAWDNDKGGRDAWVDWLRQVMEEVYRVLKPGAHGLVWALPRTSFMTGMALSLAGFEVRDCITHIFADRAMPKGQNIQKSLAKRLGRELSGEELEALVGVEGFNTTLKPNSEHWYLIRKPIAEKTVLDNILKYGVGGINIDACRVPGTWEPKKNAANTGNVEKSQASHSWGFRALEERPANSKGRYPANLLLSHSLFCVPVGTKVINEGKASGSHNFEPGVKDNPTHLYTNIKSGAHYGEETVEAWECVPGCPIAELDAQSGNVGKTGGVIKPIDYTDGHIKRNALGDFKSRTDYLKPNDSGGASRFYPNFNLSPEELEEAIFRYMAKATTSERGELNNHPTLKPLNLMNWLITLICPPGSVVLDCFSGSGTTLLAAKRGGWHYIGMELSPAYHKIIEDRLQRG